MREIFSMLVERLFTKYLKHKNAALLKFDEFEEFRTPVPEQGHKYLLYIHIPFCEELCPYCSFNRYKLERGVAKEYFKALDSEIGLYRDRGFNFSSVYVGGGTPTVLPDEMAQILLKLKDEFNVKEISLETNPNHLVDDVVRKMKQAGVNRLSVGVQSFDDGLLKKMERFHKYGSGEEIKNKLGDLMGTFDTLNVDMIFNFPTQTLDMLEYDLEVIRGIRADQATFYPLMVSDVTRHELAKRFGKISYAQEKRFYDKISDVLDSDYSCGTAWCFSRKKGMIDEYVVDYDEYVGVGSGSFGYVNGACFANTFSLQDYSNLLNSGKLPLMAKKAFRIKDRVSYYLMMKLFSTSLDMDEAEKKFNGKFQSLLFKELAALKLYGALTQKGAKLNLTRKGRYLWVVMMREFFTGVNNFRDICRSAIDFNRLKFEGN